MESQKTSPQLTFQTLWGVVSDSQIPPGKSEVAGNFRLATRMLSS